MRDQAEVLRKMVCHSKSAKPRIIAVTSGKGGVGKTNLSVNLGLVLVEQGYRVALFDVDLGTANADIVLGISPEYNLSHVIRGKKMLDEILVEGPMGLKILAGGSGVYEFANLSSGQLEDFTDSLEQLNDQFDFIILDTGAGIHRNVISFVLASSEVIVVTTPEPTALMDAYGVIKVILQEDPTTDIHLVVNMAHNPQEAELALQKLNTVLGQFLHQEIKYAGYILHDQHVAKAVADQLPVVLAYPSSMTSRSIRRIAHWLLGNKTSRPLSPQSGAKRFFSKVYQLLRN